MDDTALLTLEQNLERLLTPLKAGKRHLVIAFSGGVDSTLLLLAAQSYCARSGDTLSAVHVHHGLSPNADKWLTHCQAQCESLQIPFYSEHVTLEKQPRQSLEAVARDARYQALLQFCKAHSGILLLGHHLEDQLETVLLQLKRGSGPKGLAAMGESQLRDGVRLLRPMLMLEKAVIKHAVHSRGVGWVEDESNDDERFDRNFLRNQVLPLLLARWPQFPQTVARSAQLCAEQDSMIETEARHRLQNMLGAQQQLLLGAFRSETEGWQRAILRVWLGEHKVTVPGAAQLEQVRNIQHARQDAQPQVTLGAHSIRRFEDALFIVEPASPPPTAALTVPTRTYMPLPWLGVSVMLTPAQQAGASHWELQAGMPSVRVKPEDESVSKPLKQWVKLWKIPVWERPAVSVVFHQSRPAAVITKNRDIVLSPFVGMLTIDRKVL